MWLFSFTVTVRLKRIDSVEAKEKFQQRFDSSPDDKPVGSTAGAVCNQIMCESRLPLMRFNSSKLLSVWDMD